MSGPVDLVVLVNGFPRLSETFVLQELLHLEEQGLRLLVVALSDPHEAIRQDDLARLRATVEYLPEPPLIDRRRRLRAHAALLRARGRPYPAALARATRMTASSKSRRRGLLLAERIVALGSPPLYIHFAHKPATMGRVAATLAGVRYGLSCHAKDIWLTPPDELAAKVSDAEVVLTCTATGRDELARHAAGRTPVVLAYHGVDVTHERERAPADAGAPRILTVGRLVEKKGHDTLIRAAAVLRDRGVPFTLRIAGDGVEWPRLQRLVHALALERHVFFLGPLTPLEVRAEYARASAFALACRTLANGDRDGLPNVVMEAMTYALPVVSTRQSGVAEAVEEGRTGLLVPPDDPAAFAAALERVLADPGLAARLAAGARDSVRARFDRTVLLPEVATALRRAGLIPEPDAQPQAVPVPAPVAAGREERAA